MIRQGDLPGQGVAVGTLWPCGGIIVLPVLSLFFRHFFPCCLCFSVQWGAWVSDSSGWCVCHRQTHAVWADGAAWRVWQITLLVVGVNPVPTAALPSTPPTVLCGRHTHTGTLRRRCDCAPHTKHLLLTHPCISYLYTRLSAWPPKTSKRTLKNKKHLNIKCFA